MSIFREETVSELEKANSWRSKFISIESKIDSLT